MNTKQTTASFIFKMPFHEAEQHSKERQKRFGGVYPVRGYKLQVIRILRISSEAASDWLPFLLIRFLCTLKGIKANKENE